MPTLDIGEVSRRTGLAPSALRFYEERGLIRSAGRNGLRRQYQPEQLDRLAVVIVCRASGFTLSEIEELLATGGEAGWKDLVRRKLDEVRERSWQLSRMADGLEHALSCTSANVMQCGHFRTLLDSALSTPAGPPSQDCN